MREARAGFALPHRTCAEGLQDRTIPSCQVTSLALKILFCFVVFFSESQFFQLGLKMLQPPVGAGMIGRRRPARNASRRFSGTSSGER